MALALVVLLWRGVLEYVQYRVNSSNVLNQADRLQDVLFDDDTFSNSKLYFWAINLIHELIKLLDDSIQQWTLYRSQAVTPWKDRKASKADDNYYWYQKSQEALASAEQQGEEACTELESLKREFQEDLERIIIMRDGLFNANAVMESRSSTRLGENVKLLTFVSISFLPLGLCVAIWSVNESYSRASLAVVTVIVAAVTYILTLNLNNVIWGLRKLYAPVRRDLILVMTEDPSWEDLGRRFQAFERFKTGHRQPLEWVILRFFFKRLLRVHLQVLYILRAWATKKKRSDVGGSEA
ncbi:hypothetical protein C7999DRAFT_37654 [Corynascus novoguineensis]|uniref:Uncharacterized protein n=1 Tax=Corynascus novoguineensis TaxID=1126955 RepID=A0AAN7HU73_9PEZI|nr:hypothetical protein C7999DRAFT_37654 [Corynascus novoguineensis]